MYCCKAQELLQAFEDALGLYGLSERSERAENVRLVDQCRAAYDEHVAEHACTPNLAPLPPLTNPSGFDSNPAH